jgi:hypothetical protein
MASEEGSLHLRGEALGSLGTVFRPLVFAWFASFAVISNCGVWVQVHCDVEPIQHLQCLTGLVGEDVQARSPQVAAHKPQAADHFVAQRSQSPAQGGLRAALAHPQQPPAMTVNLIDHRQETIGALAPAPMNLVHPDRMDVFQLPVGQAPLPQPFHRAIDTFPTGAQGPGAFPPREPTNPAAQKAPHRDGHRSFALALPHSGTKSRRRSGSRSCPGAGRWQREQRAGIPPCDSVVTSMLRGWPLRRRQSRMSWNTKPGKC